MIVYHLQSPPLSLSLPFSLSPSLSIFQNLKHLQAHKGNLFEVNLPRGITKIIEAPQNTTVREALVNVLKKYNYSLDVMEVRLTSTLQVRQMADQ